MALRLLLTLILVAGLERAEGHQWQAGHPDWLLPAWTADGPAAWTMVGAPAAGSVSLIGADGSFAPRNHGPSISLWLYDLDNGRLLVPAEHAPQVHLDDDWLPIVTHAWSADDLQVQTTFFGARDPGVTFVRLTVSTATARQRHLVAHLALRPFGVEPDIHPIASASCDANEASLSADGQLVLVGMQPADNCGATRLALGDVSTFALGNRSPSRTDVTDADSRAEAMLRLSISPSANAPGQLEFRAATRDVPATSDVRQQLRAGAFDSERAAVADAWRARVGHVSLELPDARLAAAFRASQVYLLLNRRGSLPRSGPLAHDALWVRDAAYMGQALERVGAAADNEAIVEALLALQRPDGSVPAITDINGPRPVDEWDAPGQAIGATVAHYRFSRDGAWLARQYPKIVGLVGFLDALRGRSPDTLLPPNFSAEDLGSASWQHYWDDFWAVAGYREAAFAATQVGAADDAAAFAARGDDLEAALVRSINTVRQTSGKSFIPNGPDDVLSSSMARGTTPALWPIRSVRSRAGQDLLGPSFDSYYAAWLAPHGGGYQHYQGTLWPYGGLGIAHAMLRLGMRDQVQQVLRWTIDHQTLPGAYAWGEAINPNHGGLELGDMPHSWAAAELISLLRDVLLSEEDGVLLVGDGVPEDWLAPGRRVALSNAPTEYGTARVSMERVSAAELRVQLEGSPPQGWRVRVPGSPLRALVDAAEVPLPVDGQLVVPSGAHSLSLRYAAELPSGAAASLRALAD